MPETKKVLILSLALILLLGIAAHGTFGFFSDTETSTGNTFTAWTAGPPKFFVSDKGDNKIYKYDASGNFVGSFDLSGINTSPSGVAVDGGDVYVLDQSDKQVYWYDSSGALQGVSTTLLRSTGGASLGNPGGLAIYDDIHDEMWVVDFGPNKIFGYVLSNVFPGDGSLNASWEIELDMPSNQQATGLAIDSSSLYVLDSADHQFYQYLKIDGSVTVSKVLKESDGDPLQNPAGTVLDGTSLWVVDSGTDKMYEYDIGSLFPDGGSLNAAFEFALDSNNTDASGV